jgi:Xaa-Pro dipeptidase
VQVVHRSSVTTPALERSHQPFYDIRRITSEGATLSREVVRRLATAATSAGLDALVCLSPENVAYSAGFVVPSQPLMRWRHAAVVITADGGTAMVCVDMEESTIRAAHPGLDLRSWAEFGGSAMASLAGLLRHLGLEGGRVGIELGYLSVKDHAELTALVPGAGFEGADALLSESRRIKTPEETELIARLSRIADGAIGAACKEVAAGATEMDLAAALTRGVYEGGAQQFKLMIVASGERSQLPNVGPSDRVLRAGDVCRVEIFPVIEGYHAGVCRTAVVGEPSPEAGHVYENLAHCRDMVLAALGPGVGARRVYELFRHKFDELGMPPISFVGHGIGVDLHERPYLAAFAHDTLEPGMVLGIEPLVYRTPYGFGMQIKDMVAIEPGGCRLLSDTTDTAEPLRIEVS